MGTGVFHEELGFFKHRFEAAVVAWMPITQSVGGVTRFSENTILGERTRVDVIRGVVVGKARTSSWNPSAPAPRDINRFALPTQTAKRKRNPKRTLTRTLYGEAQVEDTLRMLAYDGTLCLGWFGLLRANDADDFTETDLHKVRAEEQLWSARLKALHRQEKNLLRTSAAHIVVDDKGNVVAASHEVEVSLTHNRQEHVAEAAAQIRREGLSRLLIDRYTFEGVELSSDDSSLVYLNAPPRHLWVRGAQRPVASSKAGRRPGLRWDEQRGVRRRARAFRAYSEATSCGGVSLALRLTARGTCGDASNEKRRQTDTWGGKE
jgi:hypothetical protein